MISLYQGCFFYFLSAFFVIRQLGFLLFKMDAAPFPSDIVQPKCGCRRSLLRCFAFNVHSVSLQLT